MIFRFKQKVYTENYRRKANRKGAALNLDRTRKQTNKQTAVMTEPVSSTVIVVYYLNNQVAILKSFKKT